MRRRDFITLIGGAVVARPLAARAQQAGKLPTIGFLGQNTRSAGSEWTAAFVQRLRELGWIDGRTIAIDYDPFARGYVTSLARPSGNVTGVFFQQIELAAKRIQLVKDTFPDVPGATMFWDHAPSFNGCVGVAALSRASTGQAATSPASAT